MSFIDTLSQEKDYRAASKSYSLLTIETSCFDGCPLAAIQVSTVHEIAEVRTKGSKDQASINNLEHIDKDAEKNP